MSIKGKSGSIVIEAGINPAYSVTFTQGNALGFLCGPCVIESEEHVFFLAHELRKILGRFVFKASFDKANRSSIHSYRGPGLEDGMKILGKLRTEGFPVLTDIHEPEQAELIADSVDIIQIPAFLCRQTDLLVEAGRTGKIVNIKKGQFVSPGDFLLAAEKVASTGNHKILLTERGSSFGYNNLVVDMRGLQIMRSAGYPVIFDVTHSVQLPGGGGDRSVGQPEFIETLSRAAVATGIEGLFLEVHEAPERALSDGPNSLRLDLFPALAKRLLTLDSTVKSPDF